MAKKKKSRKRKPRKKKGPEELSWPELGSMIAGKVEKEHIRKPKVWGWHWTNVCRPRGGHFLAALVFAVTLMYVLGQQGIIFDQVNIWLKALLALAFAWMFS